MPNSFKLKKQNFSMGKHTTQKPDFYNAKTHNLKARLLRANLHPKSRAFSCIVFKKLGFFHCKDSKSPTFTTKSASQKVGLFLLRFSKSWAFFFASFLKARLLRAKSASKKVGLFSSLSKKLGFFYWTTFAQNKFYTYLWR